MSKSIIRHFRAHRWIWGAPAAIFWATATVTHLVAYATGEHMGIYGGPWFAWGASVGVTGLMSGLLSTGFLGSTKLLAWREGRSHPLTDRAQKRVGMALPLAFFATWALDRVFLLQRELSVSLYTGAFTLWPIFLALFHRWQGKKRVSQA